MTTENIDLTQYLTDARGRLVPVESIKEIDVTRDELVKEIVGKSKELSALLRKTKYDCLGDIEAFIHLSSEKYGVTLGGEKGNVSLVSFCGRYKVMRAISEELVFDERLQAAKTLIDECLQEWGAGSRKEIRTIIADAFSVNKEGQINTARVLTLRRYNFEDEKWQRAMVAISDSLAVSASRTYMRVYERDEKTGRYNQIPLDLSAV